MFMPSQRRAVLLAILAVAVALFLLDVHGSPQQLVDDLRETWHDLRGQR
jgi:hypothetical protein